MWSNYKNICILPNIYPLFLYDVSDKENMEQVISNITKEGVKYAVTDIGKGLNMIPCKM